MARVVDKIILLAPTSWQELPGPSFLDPVMDHIKELDPQEIWGLGWPERRQEICAKEGTEELCAHPFMAEGMETSQPMPVREWKLQQQMAEAKQFQEWISEHVEKGQKSETFPIDEINQVPIYMIQPKSGGGMSTERVIELSEMIKSTKSLRIVEQYTDWRDFYTRPDLAFEYLVEALEVDVKAIKRKIRPKKSAFEEADPADKVEAVEDADTVKVDL